MERRDRECRSSFLWVIVPAVIALTGCKEVSVPAGQAIAEATSVGATAIAPIGAGTNGDGRPSNYPPTISGSPKLITIPGSVYTFLPASSDPDGDRLGFSIRNKPRWASFDPNTGMIQGTPLDDDLGLDRGIIVSVSDGVTGKSLPPFTIQVSTLAAFDAPEPGLASPEIGGRPAALAAVDQFYFFQPSAGDADGDSLEFEILNKPSWLDFDIGSGTLSGAPRPGDVGSYAEIWIIVSDGLSSSYLGPFDIEVVATAIGSHSVTLSWFAPIENEDGSVLLDLAGFRVRYGLYPNNYQNLIDTNNPRTVTLGIDDLLPNTYYFVVSAYNSDGTESDFSNEAVVTLN